MEELRVSQSNQIKSNQNYFCHQEEHEQCNDIHASLKSVTQTQKNIHKIVAMAGVSCWEAESRWKGSQLMPPSFCGDYSRLCTSDSVQQFHKSISFTARTPECEIKHLTRTRSFAERYTLTSDPLQLIFFLFWQFRGILKGGSEQTCKKKSPPTPLC